MRRGLLAVAHLASALIVAVGLAMDAQASAPLKCDADRDGDIDRKDLSLIAAARNQPASGPTDPRDADNDGKITVVDGRICALRCTLAGCAEPPPSGNRAPIANAGADQTVFTGMTVTLDGTASSDPDGNPLTYRWRFLARPTGSAAALSSTTAARPTFVADVPGRYEVELVVNDGTVDSPADTVLVNTEAMNTAPVANAGPDQTNAFVGIPVNLDGSASSDVDGDTLSFAWAFVSRPAGSAAALVGAGTVNPRFTPDLRGEFVLRLTVSDGRGGSSTDQVLVSTENTDRPPVANAGPDQSVQRGQLVQLAGSGADPDLDPITGYAWSFVSRPDGSAAVLAGGSTATPSFTADRSGDFIVQLIVTANGVASAADTVVVTTDNVRPVAVAGPDQTATVGDTVSLDGSASFDANGDALGFLWSFVSVPAGSGATLSGSGTPYASFLADVAGPFVLQLIVNDGELDSVPDSAIVTVNAPANRSPVAANDSATTAEDTSVLINVLGNDTDEDGDTLTISAVSQPANGSAAVEAGQVRFIPAADFNGQTSFTYSISDGNGGTSSATVTVTVSPVNDDPVAVDDAASTARDTAVDVNVTANDTDVDGDTLTVTGVGAAANGTVTIVNASTVRYTPGAGYAGADAFSYTISDGNGGTATANVAITVSATNRAPVANDDAATTDEDTAVTVPVLANDSDPDNDTLTVTAVTQSATGGAVAITTGGTAVQFTPAANFNGQATFTYTVSDGQLTDTASVTITVNAVNDDPVAVDDAASTARDTAVDVNVTANDTDVDGDTLTVTGVGAAANGTVTIVNASTVRYTPGAGYAGADAFSYTISDGNGGTATANVAITVSATNRAPVANDDAATTQAGVPVTVAVLTNDTDADGDNLTVSAVTQPAGAGSVVIAAGNTAVIYTPAAGFTGQATFSYTASDGNGGTATANVTVTVTALPTLSIGDVSLAEGNGGATTATFVVTLSAASSDVVTVQFATADGTATAGSDYLAASGTITFPAGISLQNVSVQVFGDSLFEADETFTATLSGPVNAAIADGVGTGTILNDDTPPAFTVGDVTLEEGDSGSTAFIFSVSLSGVSGLPATVDFQTANGTASAPSDYAALAGSVTIPAGELDGTIVVSVAGDTQFEADETFLVNLSNPVNATIADGQGIGTIANDDLEGAISLAAPPGTVTVGQQLSGTITLGAPAPAGGVQVALSSSNPAAATVSPSSVVIGEGATSGAFTITGVTAGSATISAAAPGYATGTLDVTIGFASLRVLQVGAPIGAGLQDVGFRVALDFAGHGGVTVRVQSNDPSRVLLSASADVPGTPFIDLPVADGEAVSPAFVISGLEAALGTSTSITASAPGFFPGTSGTIFVVQPTVEINNLPATMNVGAQFQPIARIGLPLDFNSPQGVQLEQAVRAGGAARTVTFTNSNAAVARLFTSATSGQAVTTNIVPGQSRSPLTVAIGGVGFEALNAGTTAVAAAIPGFSTSVAGTVNVSISNRAPTANAGPDQTVFIVDTIQLDGSASSDPDGDALTYAWTVQTAPAGATVGFSPGAAVANPTVTVSAAGLYVFRLVVTDDEGLASAPDDVAVTVNPVPSLSINDVTVTEGDSGTTEAVFTVSISGPINRVVSVDYATANGTATAGQDYVAGAGTVTFPANSTAAQTITVLVNGDTEVESNETFFVDLASPVNATISRARGSGNIQNDDSPLLVSLAPNPLQAVTRETRNMTVSITVPAPTGGRVVTLASSAPGVAAVPASVTIAEGATSANFDVTTSATTGTATITATVAGSVPATATVEVEARTLSITLQSSVVGTGRSVTGRVILASPAPQGGTTVALGFNPVGIASANPASLSFAAGQTQVDFALSGTATGQTTLTASAAGYTSQSTAITVTNNIVSLNAAALSIGRDLQVQNGITASSAAPAGGLQVRISSASPNVWISTAAAAQGTQSVDVVIPQGTTTGPTLYVQNVGQSSGSTQLFVEVLTQSTPAFAPGNPATVTLLQSGFELYCQGTGCGFSGNTYTLDTTTQASATLLYAQTVVLGTDPTNNRLGTQSVRGGYTAQLPLASVGNLGEFRANNNFTPGAVITQVPIAANTSFTYFYFDPSNTGAGGNGTISYTLPTGYGVPLQGGQPYLQSVPLTVAATPVSFSNTALGIGRDLQTTVTLTLPGPAPAGGLTVRVNSSSPNVLLSEVATAAGAQSLDVTIPAGSSSSGTLYVQNVGQSSGTAQLTVQVLTDPNPGYAPGSPATVTLLQSGFELYCQGTGCSFSGNTYALDTTTQASATLLYAQTVVLGTDPTNNRLGAQSVRGGYTAQLPLTSVGNLGEFRANNNFTPGTVITQVPIAANTNFTYFYFDPSNTSAGGNGTISFTLPTGYGVPLQGGQPYLQSVPLTVAATLVSFSNTALGIGRDLQTTVTLTLPGPAPTGGLTVRVNSSSPNVLLSEVATAAGTQSLDVIIPAGSSSSGTLYVQNVGQSSGTAQLTVQVLTDPNPGYAPGNPATVTLLQSGFELYCQGTGCSFSGNTYTLDTTTQASATLMYLQAFTLSTDPTNNRLGTQSVRGGYTVQLPLTSVGNLGEFRANDNFTPGAVITQVPIASNTSFTYFYFDPSNTSAGGNGTISFTLPTGYGVPLQGGQPYLQSVPLTVAATPVSFSNTALGIGRDLQTTVTLTLPGPAPTGGLTVRVNSSSPNVLLSEVATAAGTQSLDVIIPAGSNSSGTLYVQNVGQSSGTAQLTVQVLTDPNPGYAPGNPATVTLLPSGFELYCQGTGCSFSGNTYTLDTTTQASATLMYLQAFTLSTDPTNNRLGAQSVRGGYTVQLPLASVGNLGEFRANNNFTPGTVITQVPIASNTSFTYFYFDPSNTSAGGNGTISFTLPTGYGVPLQGGQPYLQSVPLTVAATPVSFSNTALGIGRDLQTTVTLTLPGPAPTGGLTVRVNSSSPNVLLSEVATAAGTQSLDVIIPAGSNSSGTLYVQNVGQSSGTAQLTVQVLTDPNPGYAPGNPATVTLLPSGFELYCQGTGCSFSGNTYTLNTTTVAEPTLMYLQAIALNSDLVNNRAGAQNVRGGYTVQLPLTSVGGLGEFRANNNFTPGTVITQVPIAANTSFTYFYFDPNDTGAGGSGTISFTLPTGYGVPVQGGQPYLQSMPLTVSNPLPGGGQNLSRLPGVVVTASSEFGVGYGAQLAIDGVNSTGSSWCTANFDPAPSLSLTFPNDVTIGGIAILNPWGATYAFLSGRFVVSNAVGTQIFDSGVVSLSAAGELSLPFGTPVANARRVDFLGVTWNSIEPCLGEFIVAGSNP